MELRHHDVTDKQLVHLFVHLPARKKMVVQLTSEGWSNKEIAAKLFIQPCAVAEHLTGIYEELALLPICANRRCTRPILIALFAKFFDRHPELDQFRKAS